MSTLGTRSYRRRPGIVRRSVGAELLLFDPRDDSLHMLNPTGAFVWEQLESAKSARELAAALERAYAVEETADLGRDVERLLRDLVAHDLVEEEGE